VEYQNICHDEQYGPGSESQPVDGSCGSELFLATLSCMSNTRWSGLAERLRHDRGDVPGWVLITLMTAGLVVVIWALAGPALSSVFEQAIDRVTGL
jgi:hypothetical protein